MKKALKYIAIVFGVVAIVGVALVTEHVVGMILRNRALERTQVEISGTPVDNAYNNYCANYIMFYDGAGDLVRIGDKLYYNYYGGYETYGLYEISSEGAKRIYWDRYVPILKLPGFEPLLYPIREYDGKLLMNTKLLSDVYGYNEITHERELQKTVIQTYREETQSFEEDAFFCDVADIRGLMYQETSFGFVYESFEGDALWVYTEETGAKQIVSEHLCSFYATGELIYYISDVGKDGPSELHMFDWSSQTDTVIRQWTEYSDISQFFIEGNDLVFIAINSAETTQYLYKLDLRNPAQKETVIYKIDDNDPDALRVWLWNVWNGTAYFCTKAGLTACDLETGVTRVLYDKAVFNCAIVDDVWVYFVDNRDCLWRVPQSGGEAELVFKL